MKGLKEVDMSKVIPFDTLAYAKKLEAHGILAQHAEGHAQVLAEVLEVNFATKQETSLVFHDLSREMTNFRTETRVGFEKVAAQIDARFEKVDAEFVAVRAEMKTGFEKVDAEFVAVRAEMKTGFEKVDAEFVAVRAEMKAGFEKVDAEFVAVRNEIKAESAALRHEMAVGFANVATEFAVVRSEIKAESSALRDEFGKLRWDLIKWVFVLFFGQTAFLTAVLKWFH